MIGRKTKELEAMVTRERERAERAEREVDAIMRASGERLSQVRTELAEARAQVEQAQAAVMELKPVAAQEGEQFVLVTLAQNGNKVVKHAWGPFPTRSKAQSLGQKFQREADRDGYKVERMVLKVIGEIDPKTGEPRG